MRYLYSFLFYLVSPFLLLRLLIRSPSYRKRVRERFGYYPFSQESCLWVHAVSVGETIAAIPLIKRLQAQYPEFPILVTTMTPTGSERVQGAFGGSVRHVYLPYDLPNAVRRFLVAMQPKIAIIMETELWPNLLLACHQKQIPVCLVNARLSEKSAKGYQRISKLTHEMLQQLAFIAAHGEADAKRFIALGARVQQVEVCGNIKFDLKLDENIREKGLSLKRQLGMERFIWIGASTHEGEELMLLAAHKKLCAVHKNALLILVPRHPDRFDGIAKMCKQHFLTVRRSLNELPSAETAIYLGDTMGEMLIFYGAADVAFVGGSLVPRGGHNILEPAAFSKPILTGPHVFNFSAITDLFIEAGALRKVNDAEDLVLQLIHFAKNLDLREQMGERAKEVMQANLGALDKQLKAINEVIESTKII